MYVCAVQLKYNQCKGRFSAICKKQSAKILIEKKILAKKPHVICIPAETSR